MGGARRHPDHGISRARALLDWALRTPLKDGLARTIAYFESLLAEPGIRESLADYAGAEAGADAFGNLTQACAL